MITENLYPTYSRFYVGYTTNQYQDETTYDWNDEYSGEMVNDMSSYWLGWISPDNLPLQYRLSALYVDSETGEYCFDDITDESNFPCGYVSIAGASNTRGSLTSMKYDIDGVADYRTADRARLLNNVHPEFSGMMLNYNDSAQLGLTAYYILFDGGGNIIHPTLWTGYLPQVSIFNDTTMNQIIEAYNFLFGGATRQITISYSGVDYKFTFTADDFADGTVALWDNTNTVQVRLFLCSIGFGQGGSMNNTTQTNLRTSWCCQVTGSYDTHSVTKLACGSGVGTTGLNIYSMSQFTKTAPAYGYAGYAQNVKFPAEIVSAIQSGSEKYHWIKNMLAYHISGDVLFLPFYPMDSIRKMFSLFYRVSLTGMNGYVKNFTYATDVNSNNEFLAKLKTGNLSDTAFKNGLREWQYTDFQANDFDEDDIPPYEPEPEPGGDDTPGDEPQDLPHDDGTPEPDQDSRTLTAPSLFITQYILNYSQLRTIGTNLWQSWLDPTLEVWKNFYINFAQDTGTMDIGAVMNFIISLRVFPFDLAGMTTDYLGSSNGVYMGTGHTNFCPGTIAVLNTIIGYLDCGTCVVKPTTPYNDFRDMYNCSVLCFLPYCGTVELTPAEVIGRTLHVKYHIDFQSGSCTALVKVVGDNGEYTVASKSGQIGFTLPMTATNAGQLSAQFARDATQAVSTIGGFFFDAVKSGSDNLMSLANAMISKPKAIETDSKGNKSLNFFDNNTFETSTEIGRAGFNTAISLANQTLNMLSRSGIDIPMLSGGSGAESMMQPDTAFIQIRRGKYAKPKNYPHSQAHINGSSGKIRDFAGKFSGNPTYPSVTNKGLCKFTGVDSSGLTCHDDERAEILTLLESGIYI